MASRYPDYIEFKAGDAPPPDSNDGYVRLYAASDGSMHTLQSDGTDAEIGAGSSGGITSPLSLSGCILWLDASTLTLADDDPVETWPDGSIGGYDATQSDPDAKPVCKTDLQNGLRAVRFDTQGQTVPKWLNLAGDALGMVNGLESVTFAAALSVRGVAGGQVFAATAHGDPTKRRLFFGTTPGGGSLVDLDIGASTSDSSDVPLYASIGVGNGPTTASCVGVAVASPVTDEAMVQVTSMMMEEVGGSAAGRSGTLAPFPPDDSDAIFIGGDNTLPGPGLFDGDLFELAVYARPLNARERRELGEYLSEKWGLF